MDKTDLKHIVDDYLLFFPNDKSKLALFRKQLGGNQNVLDRHNFLGHITCSGFVFTKDFNKVLLVHHRALQKWLQPGGHMDAGETNPLATARREVVEETGVVIDRYIPLSSENKLIPIYFGEYDIPRNIEKSEPNHYHHDLCYVFIAASEDVSHKSDEVTAAKWFSLTDNETSNITDGLARIKSVLLHN
jgi:8-oxo-dGTP pyrophosphatase MutT (NUDIX family)